MLIKEESLGKIRQTFSLNIYEVKIWTALLSKGISTAGELSEISNVPRSRAYDILESLEKKGFIIMKIGKPIQYIAVKPEEILKRIKVDIQDEAKKHVETLEKVRGEEVFSELQLLFKHGIEMVQPESLSGSLKGRRNINNHLDSMISDAKKSVTMVTTADGLKRKYKSLKNSFRKAKSRGVKIRIIAPLNKLSSEDLQTLKEVAEVKQLNGINARFTIIDNKNIIFMLMNDNSIHDNYDVGIWVNTPFFASALENMFNLSWKKA